MPQTSRLLLHLPARQGLRLALPVLSQPPEPIGRRQPNGTLLVVDDHQPAVFCKFVPWLRAGLAFHEAATLAELNADPELDGVVRLAGVSATQEHLVLQLERSTLGPLDAWLRAQRTAGGPPVDAALLRSMLRQLAGTLARLHARGWVHRDLKAENVLLFEGPKVDGMPQPVPRLADFDRARQLQPGGRLDDAVGSRFHMAPELLARQPYDHKVDVYAFGILMYELLHEGARPHPGVATGMPGSMSGDDFATQVVEQDLRPEWRHEDRALQALATRCWAREPGQRPEFHELLPLLAVADAWASKASPAASPATPPTALTAPTETAAAAARPAAAPDHAPARPPAAIDAVGTASHIGKLRPAMEDAVCVLQTEAGLIACVFDGLGGARTATHLAQQFALRLSVALRQGGPVAATVEATFRQLDAELRQLEPPIECGSTGLVAVLDEHAFWISWLGDSPACLFRRAADGSAASPIVLVDRHQPHRPDEFERVMASGGLIGREQRWLDSGEAVPFGPYRVFVPDIERNNGIALSRAFGLFAFKPAIGSEPESVHLERQPDDRHLLLGSDGVFDFVDVETLRKLVEDAGSAQRAADAVIDAVLARGAPDNASIIVIDLQRVLRPGAASAPGATGDSGAAP